MNSKNLGRQRADYLAADCGRMLRYLNGLCHRLQHLGFPVDDPLTVEALAAQRAMQRLYEAARNAGTPMPTPLRDTKE